MGGITHFNPSNVYRSKSGHRPKPRKVNVQSRLNRVNEKRYIKDVILLPGPRVQCVPKGVVREELYVRGFTTTFELFSSMNEKEIRAILEGKHQVQVNQCP